MVRKILTKHGVFSLVVRGSWFVVRGSWFVVRRSPFACAKAGRKNHCHFFSDGKA
jgi:hypothetical protein